MSAGSRAIKIIIGVVLLLIVAGAVGFIAVYTNGFKTDFKTFYIQYDGKKILDQIDGMQLPQDKEVRFDLKSTFGTLKEPSKVSVKVLPDVKHGYNFDFLVDGEIAEYGALDDLSKGFDVKVYDEYFTLDLSRNLYEILQLVFAGKNIEMPEDRKNQTQYFTIVIASADGKSSLRIGFCFYVTVTGLELDQNEVLL